MYRLNVDVERKVEYNKVTRKLNSLSAFRILCAQFFSFIAQMFRVHYTVSQKNQARVLCLITLLLDGQRSVDMNSGAA